MITPGTLRRQAQTGMAFRTPAMPGFRESHGHARQRSDTVRALVARTPISTADPLHNTWPGEQGRGGGEQPVVLADAFASWASESWASERCIDLHGLQVTRAALGARHRANR